MEKNNIKGTVYNADPEIQKNTGLSPLYINRYPICWIC